MSCPFASSDEDGGVDRLKDIRNGEEACLSYSDYLMLDKLLDCQKLQSEVKTSKTAADELLFIVTHQAYELWFKEVIFEIDSIRKLFLTESRLNEDKTLHIISLLKRIVAIFKLLKDQFQCLETMSPFGFMEFRNFISPASGFQSTQFRILEKKLGVPKTSSKKEEMILSSKTKLNAMKTGKEREDVEEFSSLQQIVQQWLSRTPGLEEDGFNFYAKFKSRVNVWLVKCRVEAEAQTNQAVKDEMLKSLKVTTDTFETIFDEEKYNKLVSRGERRFSHKAFQGALMIYLYRDEPRFHQPYQILQLLIDIDSLIIKWRYNHLMLVQRTIGSKAGTGGTSGYQYLRSTISDRYKVFLDLVILSNYLVPLDYIPPLSTCMKTELRQLTNYSSESDSARWSGSSDGEEHDIRTLIKTVM